MLHAELVSAFQDRARSGKVCFGIHTSAMSPQLVELYGLVQVDFVIIGAEVESLDISRMEELIRAADAARTVPIVKLRRPDPDLIGEAMNAGAPMLMLPRITTRAQLETMVRAAQFAPEGTRGPCPIARYNGYGALNLADASEAANRSHAIIPIIEDAEALEHVEDMMHVPEVDIFEIAVYHLSQSLGETGLGFEGPRTMAAIERICAAAQRHQKAVLTPLWYPKQSESYRVLIQHQMDELISRGINCLYDLESAFLALHTARLTLLRRVVEVKEEPPKKAKGKPPDGKPTKTRKRGASSRFV